MARKMGLAGLKEQQRLADQEMLKAAAGPPGPVGALGARGPMGLQAIGRDECGGELSADRMAQLQLMMGAYSQQRPAANYMNVAETLAQQRRVT